MMADRKMYFSDLHIFIGTKNTLTSVDQVELLLSFDGM